LPCESCAFEAHTAPYEGAEHDSRIVSFVVRCVHERRRPAVAEGNESGEGIAISPQFRLVALLELEPTLGVVRGPFPQFRARRDLFEPHFDVRIFFEQAAWPQALDEDS
jgi:hypothetical protein